MSIWDFADKHEKECEVVLKDGSGFRGVLYLGETEFDSMSGENEIDIHVGNSYVCIPVSEIMNVALI